MLLQPHHFQGNASTFSFCFSHAISVADLNPKVDEFLEGRAKGKTIVGCYSIEEMVANLEKPCRIQLMVKAGEVVDQFIEKVIPHLSAGDIIIDGGNRCSATAALPRLPG